MKLLRTQALPSAGKFGLPKTKTIPQPETSSTAELPQVALFFWNSLSLIFFPPDTI